MTESKELYRKLVDLYAGGELPTELEEELREAARHDSELGWEMATLRRTVELTKEAHPSPEFGEESFQRILIKLYTRAGQMQTQSPEPAHLQYHLPIQG